MRRPWQVWLAFAFCLLIAVASVGWISAKAIDISRRESQARSDAKLEEHTRLALWRIDSAMAPILARESARSVFAYSPFYPLSGAIPSTASDLPSIIMEMQASRTSEREGRLIDSDSVGSMEKKKQEGYF